MTAAVAGSNPASPVFLLSNFNNYGPLAQVVEHLTFNQVVRGSSPRWLTEDRRSKERRFFCGSEAIVILGQLLSENLSPLIFGMIFGLNEE